MNMLNNSQGHIALYALVILPIVLTLTSVAVDVSNWNAMRDTLQQEAEAIALHAGHALPDSSAAQSIAQARLSQLAQQEISGEIAHLTPASIGVVLRAQHHGVFTQFIQQGSELFRIERRAVAQLLPIDAIIVMADGHSLRPGISSSGTPDEPWGNWPSSLYLSLCVTPSNISDGSTLWNWAQNWDELHLRWATQSCFNPVLSPLKEAVISLIDTFGTLETSRLGVFFTPGGQPSGYAMVRALANTPPTPGGYFEPHQKQASWISYQEWQTLLGNEACVLFSDATIGSNYHLPSPRGALGVPYDISDGCHEPVDQTNSCGQDFYPYDSLLPCYLNQHLLLREAVYWNAAKLPSTLSEARPNVRAALRAAVAQFAAATVDPSKRGNLAATPKRLLVVFTDQLLSIDTEVLENLQTLGVDLVLVAYAHPQLPPATKDALLQNADALAQSNFAKIIVVDNPAQLSSQVIPLILKQSRSLTIKQRS